MDLNLCNSTNLTCIYEAVKSKFAELDANYDPNLTTNLDQWFVVNVAIIIFFMQAGFACLEAGAVRQKNTVNILVKNGGDTVLGALIYWAVGWGFAFGGSDSKFIGHGHFFLANLPSENYSVWFFHFVFAATAATIVSGAMAERTSFLAYAIYSVFITGFVYPVVSHWAWSGSGWLGANGYTDFAGSGVVHCVGGMAALMGAAILGPRIDRFNINGSVQNIPGHSMFLSSLGAFILWFGFFAFNGGSQAAISNTSGGALDSEIVARCVVNTVLAGSGGALAAMVIIRLLPKEGHFWSLMAGINGSLGGMVAICAGCNVLYPWSALIVGIVAGVVVIIWSKALLHFRIDDPLDACPVHLGAGLWGLIATPIFMEDGIIYTGSRAAFETLGVNIYGGMVICAWTGVLTGTMFLILRKFKQLRVDETHELMGLDESKHGETAYPESDLAYVLGTTKKSEPSLSLVPMSTTGKEQSDEVSAV